MFEYITKDIQFNEYAILNLKNEIPSYHSFPCVYLIYCNKRKELYIGETTNISNRLKQHLKSESKNKLKNVTLILSHYFNKSAVLDIESNLIQNMVGDNNFKLLNANDGIANHNYYQKDKYQETFEGVWKDKLLKEKNIVKKDLLDIQNSDLFRYSPYKSLSEDQYDAVKNYLEVLLDPDVRSTFVQGSAGTGKTIVAIYIIKLLVTEIDIDEISEESDSHELLILASKVKCKLAKNRNLEIALVVPMSSLRKTLKNVFKGIYGLSPKMVIGPSEVKSKDYDLLIIDESHRLKQRKALSGVIYGSMDKTNEYLGLVPNSTELDWILKKSEKQLFFYDDKQSIKPADIDKKDFDNLKKDSKIIDLKSQMRVKGGDDYIKFVDRLLTCSSNIESFKSKEYELKLFSNMTNLVATLQEKENTHRFCRMISGYSWKWVSKNTDLPDVNIEGIEFRWNKKDTDWINSTTDLTEIGCIHTTQGYDLNYAGVIFGKEIVYSKENNRIEIIKSNYHDRKGKEDITNEMLHTYIINIYKTIMYRGIKGTFVYCCDENLREYFSNFMEVV